MSTIVTRAGKGSPLTNTELDSNFTNLNTDKLELSGGTLTGNLSLGDNVKLQLGNQTNGDLQLYHDGSASRIVDAGTGSLKIQAENFAVNNVGDTENMITAEPDGAVALFHNGSPKIATTATGADITGVLTADGLTSELGSDAQGKFSGWSPTGSTSTVHGAIELGSNASYQGIISYDGSNNTRFLFDNAWSGTGSTFEFRTNTAATAKTHLKIEGTGDISFYDSAGTSQNLFWDSSTSRLGLGTTVPASLLHIQGNTDTADSFLTIEDADPTTGSQRPHIKFVGNGTQLGKIRVLDNGTGMQFLTGSSDNIRLAIDSSGSSVFSGAVTSTGAITTSTRVLSPEFRVMEGTSLAGGIFKEKNLTGSGSSLDLAIFAEGISNGGDIHFYTGGALPSKMTIASNGNVNIPNGSLMVGATTAPSSRFHLKSASRGSVALRVTDSDTTNDILRSGSQPDGDGYLQLRTVGGAGNVLFDASGDSYVNGGNFGIGVVPAYKLHISGATNANDVVIQNSSHGVALRMQANTNSMNIFTTGSKPLYLGTNNTTNQVVLDTSGNLLVGTTSTSLYNDTSGGGINLFANGGVTLAKQATSVSDPVLLLNNTGTAGQMIDLRQDGTTVGSIGTASTSTYIDGGSEFSGLQFGGDGTSEGRVVPRRDGAIADGETTLGTSLYRFKDLYLSGNATAQKLTLTKAPVGTYTIEVDGTNTGQPNLIVKQSTSERLRIDNLGRVGIGTSSPIRVLDIATTTGGTIIHLTDDATGHTATDGVDIQQEGTLFQILNREAGDIRFGTDNATRMTIDSSGRVGIGTDNPSRNLTVHGGAGYSILALQNDSTGSAAGDGFQIQLVGTDIYQFNYDTGFMLFGTGGQEAMRIDASRNLLVGTTSNVIANASTSVGTAIGAGLIESARAGVVAQFNRQTSDGTIIDIQKSGTTVGLIGTVSGDLYIGTGDTTLKFEDGADRIVPRGTDGAQRDGAISLGSAGNRFNDLYLAGSVNIGDAKTVGHGAISLKYDLVYMTAGVISPSNSDGTDNDNSVDLGKSAARFDDIYATNGTIQTSDRNEKQDIEDLTEAEERVAVAAKGLLKKFRWKSVVEDKGDDARIHFGIIAQDLQAAFEAEGLDAGRYGMFTSNTWTNEDGDEQTRMGVRYSELLAFIISAI